MRSPLPDESAAGDMATAYHILRNAGVAPPWIEADRRARHLLDERDALLQRELEALDDAILAPDDRGPGDRDRA